MSGAPDGLAPAVALIVLDGWGLAPAGPGNAVSLASTPVFDRLWSQYPHTELSASGTAVGLPDGQMGNSEVGHLNLGAGAVVKQDLVRIDEAARSDGLASAGRGRVGSVVGRYFAMDRDRRWDRIQLAYDLLVHGQAEHSAASASAGVRAAYERGETDEFIRPVLVGSEDSRIRPEDSV